MSERINTRIDVSTAETLQQLASKGIPTRVAVEESLRVFKAFDNKTLTKLNFLSDRLDMAPEEFLPLVIDGLVDNLLGELDEAN